MDILVKMKFCDVYMFCKMSLSVKYKNSSKFIHEFGKLHILTSFCLNLANTIDTGQFGTLKSHFILIIRGAELCIKLTIGFNTVTSKVICLN